MAKSLTIVLPVYNAESRLRSNVTELLELASELTPEFGVLIIDDGSTDATYEVAGELASQYPQVLVRRHRQQRGLGAVIDYVQRRVRSDAVMLHDGVTPVNTQQMRSVWQRWVSHSVAPKAARSGRMELPQAAGEFAGLGTTHREMERAHRRVLGFQLITCPRSEDPTPIEGRATGTAISRPDAAHWPAPRSVGQIPPLPRPKFLTAVAAFALGE